MFESFKQWEVKKASRLSPLPQWPVSGGMT